MVDSPPVPNARFDAIYRDEGRRAFATLVRRLGDFDRAEEALHDAFRAALAAWPRDGVPANPAAWLVAVGQRRDVDAHRRSRRWSSLDVVDEDGDRAAREPVATAEGVCAEPDEVADDPLRLIFTCCHPGLGEAARVALTLREVCGLSTEQIARAFVQPAPTLAQRIVRAKAKIRTAGIPFEVPAGTALAERLPSVLRVVYLVFNEGYSSSRGADLMAPDLADEAVRLCRTLVGLLPEPEVLGLLALLLLQRSRAAARVDAGGDLVPLEEQDRGRWDRADISEGVALVERALRSGRAGSYSVQAAIAAVHAEAPTAAATDWRQIAALYDVLVRLEPQPIVALNRAVAVAMAGDLLAGIRTVEALLAESLGDYHLAHAAHADLCRRAGDRARARASYQQALARTEQEPERRFLRRRLHELDGQPQPGP
ncbi:MAG: RNA polymerase subunit sigma-24 [Planctomycetes bacterium]|nr:RNA polymerase subunit sigma-24 [Planctomycetota bacterium]